MWTKNLRQKMEAMLKKLIDGLFFGLAGLLGIFSVSLGGYSLMLGIIDAGKWRQVNVFVGFCALLFSFVAFYFFWLGSKKLWRGRQKPLWLVVAGLSVLSFFVLAGYDQLFLRG